VVKDAKPGWLSDEFGKREIDERSEAATPKDGGRVKESLRGLEERLEAARRKTICKGDIKTAQEENTDEHESIKQATEIKERTKRKKRPDRAHM